MSFPDNFPDEAFYFLAEARMSVAGADGPTRARLVLALEAAFGGTGAVTPTTRVVFARIRVRADDLVPGATYRVTHPYGVLTSAADDRGRLFVTDDRGIADEDVDRVLGVGQIAPFLVAAGAPTGYLGDGATPSPVTGSPFGTDVFRLERQGPAGWVDPDAAETDLFTVQGRVADRHGVAVDTATYAREASGEVRVSVHAHGAPGQEYEADSAETERVAFTTSGRVAVLHAAASAPPAHIDVVNVTDASPTRVRVPVSDAVVVTSAVHDLAARTLTVAATSSDPAAAVLTADGFGPLGSGDPTVFADVAVTPSTLRVSSSLGGVATAAVAVTGPTAARLPLAADAGPDLVAVVGEPFRLDGRGSRGGVLDYAWVGVGDRTPTIADPAAPVTTATADVAGPARVLLRVSGASGTAEDEVAVDVRPLPPPERFEVVSASYRTRTRRFRVDGTLVGTPPARVSVAFRGQLLGESAVAVGGGFSLRVTLTGAQSHLVPGVGDALALTSSRGAVTAAALAVRA